MEKNSNIGYWFTGGEAGTQEPGSAYKIRLLIARLSTYRDVALSCTHQILGQIAREVEGCFVDYAYLPPPEDIKYMTNQNIPLWTGTTSKAAPQAFDVLAISNSVALELLNLPALLKGSGIPLGRKERMERKDIPLIIMGGTNAPGASILHGAGGLVDAVIVGDGEDSLSKFLHIVLKGKEDGWSKEEVLGFCHGKVDGFYDPSRYQHLYDPLGRLTIIPDQGVAFPVQRAVCDLNKHRGLEDGFIPYDEKSIGTASYQISQGCPFFCSFCQEGYQSKPYREREMDLITKSLMKIKANHGLSRIQFLAFSYSAHSKIYEILLKAAELFSDITLKSQNLSSFYLDPYLADFLHRLGKTSLSFGIEGISQRLRNYLGKDLEESDIYKGLTRVLKSGPRAIKFFLIRTGLEQEEDFAEFDLFLTNLNKLLYRTSPRIIFSVTPLMISPHTPLQFEHCRLPAQKHDHILEHIQKTVENRGFQFREALEGKDAWIAQLLHRGDRRLTDVLIRSSLAGYLYYQSIPNDIQNFWHECMTESNLTPSMYLREFSHTETVPWDDINMGVKKGYLISQHSNLREFQKGEHCFNERCNGCGACSSQELITLKSKKIAEPVADVMVRLDKIIKSRTNKQFLNFEIMIAKEQRLVPKSYFGQALARAMMRVIPEAVIPYIGPESDPPFDYPYFYGLLPITLSFTKIPSALLTPSVSDAILHQAKGFSIESVRAVYSIPDYTAVSIFIESESAPDVSRLRDALEKGSGQKLPLGLHKKEGGYLLAAEGKKAAKSPVTKVLIQGQSITLDIKLSFDFKAFLKVSWEREPLVKILSYHVREQKNA